jgi:hypothetical protein
MCQNATSNKLWAHCAVPSNHTNNLMSAEVSFKISWRYHPLMSNEDRVKRMHFSLPDCLWAHCAIHSLSNHTNNDKYLMVCKQSNTINLHQPCFTPTCSRCTGAHASRQALYPHGGRNLKKYFSGYFWVQYFLSAH